MVGLIPLISVIDHPMASRLDFKMAKRASSCVELRSEAMMTGRISDGPRKAYFKSSGKGLSSGLGVVSEEEEGVGSVQTIRGSGSIFHPLYDVEEQAVSTESDEYDSSSE